MATQLDRCFSPTRSWGAKREDYRSGVCHNLDKHYQEYKRKSGRIYFPRNGAFTGNDKPNCEENFEMDGVGSRMLFTDPKKHAGPDYIRNHRVSVETDHRYVGIGSMSPEGTSEADYLWRASPGTPFPRSRSGFVGEIGWGIPLFTDWNMPLSGCQITLGEFRQECEDRHTHLYQNPWYPYGEKEEAGTEPEFWEARLPRCKKPDPVPKHTCSRPQRHHRGRSGARSAKRWHHNTSSTDVTDYDGSKTPMEVEDEGGATEEAPNKPVKRTSEVNHNSNNYKWLSRRSVSQRT